MSCCVCSQRLELVAKHTSVTATADSSTSSSLPDDCPPDYSLGCSTEYPDDIFVASEYVPSASQANTRASDAAADPLGTYYSLNY